MKETGKFSIRLQNAVVPVGGLQYRKLGVKEEIFFPLRSNGSQYIRSPFAEALSPSIFPREGPFPCGSVGVPERAVILFVIPLLPGSGAGARPGITGTFFGAL